MKTKTPGGIARPRSGDFRSFAPARAHAKNLNIARGRGHRAIKARDGGYSVVFRPVVAGNKQRSVREVI